MNEKKISESIKNPIHEENDNLLDAIFDQSNVMIAHMDTQFNFLRVSKAYAEADKRDTMFLIGRNHFDLYPNEENEQIFRNVVETGEPYYVKVKDFKYAEHLDWGVTSWDWSLIPIKIPNGGVKSLVLTIFNVTAQKKIEEEFLKEKEFTESALNAQRDTFFVFDPSTGKAIRWNKAFKEISGYSDEEMSISKAPETYYREDELKQLLIATEVIEQGGTTTNELNLITKEGNLIPFEYVASGIFDDDANLKYIVAIGRDITERKKAEQKLKESEEKYRILVEQSLQGIIVIQDVKIMFANPAMVEILGYSVEELLSLSTRDAIKLIHPDDRTFVLNRHNDRMEGKPVPNHYEYRIIRKDGTIRWVELYATVINYEGRIASQQVFIDITERKEAERKIKESEEKFRTLSDYSMVGISIIQDMEIKYINQRMADYLGYTREELLNLEPEGFLNIIHPDDRDRGKKISLNNQLGGKKTTDHFELRIIKKNGNTVCLDVYARTILYDGRSAAMNASIDITDRKNAEQNLKESEEKYSNLFQYSNDAIILHDLEGKIIDVNQNAIKWLGYTKLEFSKMNINQLHPSKDLETSKKKLKDIKKTRFENFEISFKRKNGEIFPADLSAKMIEIDDKTIIQGEIRDITERKKAEVKLKESEEKYRVLFESSPVGIGISNFEGNVHSMNQAMEEITGYDLKSQKQINLRSTYVNPDDRIKLLKKLKETGRVQNYFVKLRKRNGTIYDALLNIETITIANKKFVITNVQDISERIKVEKKLKELSKLKSELLSRTSHELKTPAMHIKGYADLLLHKYQDNLGIDELQIINHIKEGVLRLETLIYDILHKAELDSDTGELNKVKDNLASLIDLSVRELKSFAALRGHSIILDINETLIIDFDKDQIRHVLNNLITNSIKYTPLNGIIGINSTITDDFITIAIQDNGIGLTEEQIHRLFTQFGKIERYGQGYDIITDGTGLGLHIAKKIIDLHGGKIWVESGGRNKGSTFYFSLPKGEES